MAGAGAQSYNSAGAGDEKPEFAQHYIRYIVKHSDLAFDRVFKLSSVRQSKIINLVKKLF